MKKQLLGASVVLLLSACQSNSISSQPTLENASKSALASAVQAGQNEAQRLNLLLEEYFNESMALNPVYATFVGEYAYNDKFNEPISEASRAKDLAFEKKYLAAIKAIDADKLEGQDLLSYQIFKRDREMAILGSRFDDYLMPLDQMSGVHNYFAGLGSGSSAQPFNSAQDYYNFEQRAKGFALYMDSTIEAMREGIEKQVVLPKAIIEKVIPQLQAHVVDDVKKSVFYGPLTMLESNEQISASEKAKITASYSKMIEQVIIPAFKKTYEFMRDEYRPHGRDSVGLSALPNGKAWYEYQIAENTTLSLSAEEIHEYGQQEVARILAEMKKVKETVGFKGSLPEFFTFLKEDEQFYFKSEQEVVDAYEGVKAKINSRVGKLFEVFPKADYEVRPVEAFRAASSAGASYQNPAPDGSRPGIFYINTHNLKAQPKFIMETLSIHEASPGHHFQIAIQQEVEGLAKFRKFGGYTVFAEGWALYAESLGKEMGLFTDPYQWYGRLVDEQLRAMRLVVDTGLHAMGWSRQQAIDFMAANSSMAASDIESEVERYISIPGQALAYKIGQRAIRDMRTKAEAALGDKFDIRKFHTQILIDGALPMPVLQAKVEQWVKEQKKA
ncbi:DUF885 domain-containing protein [Thalassomonas viridans]|uniref:DUF885 domain-containing protein n=1 Tax=Thalassomonas viridans TaxID=137584 RepID=A0AAF0CAL3_9GAMM|nr:DUF885 domain-containing protein [Thalassomonas viridans]WDE05999.1 DUF885 domain-containing protein [Thalassomonas viridans]